MAVWQFRKAVRFAVVFILLTVSASTQIAQTNAGDIEGWHRLDAGPFSIRAPSRWEFHQLMGYDSFLGEFVGDGVRLRFDYGRYSNGYLKNAKKPAHIVSKRSIGGHSAKVAKPRTPGTGLTGVYVKLDGHNALWLWGEDRRCSTRFDSEVLCHRMLFPHLHPPHETRTETAMAVH